MDFAQSSKAIGISALFGGLVGPMILWIILGGGGGSYAGALWLYGALPGAVCGVIIAGVLSSDFACQAHSAIYWTLTLLMGFVAGVFLENLYGYGPTQIWTEEAKHMELAAVISSAGVAGIVKLCSWTSTDKEPN